MVKETETEIKTHQNQWSFSVSIENAERRSNIKLFPPKKCNLHRATQKKVLGLSDTERSLFLTKRELCLNLRIGRRRFRNQMGFSNALELF